MKRSEYAAQLSRQIADDDTYGYSNDWPENTFWDNTPKDGDCGAFCSYVYKLAGVIPEGQYYEPTGSTIPYNDEMLQIYFDRYDYYTKRDQIGALVVSNGHTAIVTSVDPREYTHAADDYDGQSGDSTGMEIRTDAAWDNGNWNWIYILKPEYDTEIGDVCMIELWPCQLESRGGHVETLQATLNAKNDAGLLVDGYYGLLTEAAVKDWQTKYDVTGGSDGICGTYTWTSVLQSERK